MNQNKTIMVSAGEASGDMHGAELIHELKKIDNTLEFKGMGSDAIKKSGCRLIINSANIAVVGIFEVLAHWKEIKHALNALKQEIINSPPDLLILIDYPEFNLKIAHFAKQRGVKVLFYISPQIWAWRPKRVHKIGRAIDMMAVVFPFEVGVYEKNKIPVKFVGHPLTKKVKTSLIRDTAIQHFNLNSSKLTVGLFPGSRNSELKRLLPIQINAAKIISEKVKNIQFIIPVAATLDRKQIEAYINDIGLNITITEDYYYDAINICDSIITASGTATLEVALLGTPMAIIYQVSAFSYFIMSRMIQIENIGLANIVAEKQIVPEFVQHQAKPEPIAEEIIKQLTDQSYRDSIKTAMSSIQQKLVKNEKTASLAQVAIDLIRNNSSSIKNAESNSPYAVK